MSVWADDAIRANDGVSGDNRAGENAGILPDFDLVGDDNAVRARNVNAIHHQIFQNLISRDVIEFVKLNGIICAENGIF